MATTIALSTLRDRLRIYLNDTNSRIWTDDDELDLFINQALVKFSHDMPTASACSYTVSGHEYDLPDDYVVSTYIRGYFESTAEQEFVHELRIKPGAWDTDDEPTGFFIDWPTEGKLYLPREPDDTPFVLYYGAFWNSWLTADADTWDYGRNRWGEQAVLAYASYLAFNPSSARRAQLEQWNRRGDQNVGNPLEEEANRWLSLYESLVAEHAEHPASWQFIQEKRY